MDYHVVQYMHVISPWTFDFYIFYGKETQINLNDSIILGWRGLEIGKHELMLFFLNSNLPGEQQDPYKLSIVLGNLLGLSEC